LLPFQFRLESNAQAIYGSGGSDRQRHSGRGIIDLEMLAGIDAQPIHLRECSADRAAGENGERIPDGRHEFVDQLDRQCAVERGAICNGELAVLAAGLLSANARIKCATGTLCVTSGYAEFGRRGGRVHRPKNRTVRHWSGQRTAADQHASLHIDRGRRQRAVDRCGISRLREPASHREAASRSYRKQSSVAKVCRRDQQLTVQKRECRSC
jgi:hypothetical protein